MGFGEAGSLIIQQNIASRSEINPFTEGQKCVCIFGFCQIRNFAVTTSVLQEGIVLFVNEISQIVHGIVYDYSGAVNKNIGDSFLIVWKTQSKGLEVVHGYEVTQVSEMSLISFLKILAAIQKSHTLLKFRTRAELI